MIKDITFLILAKNEEKSLLFVIFERIKKIKTKYLYVFNTDRDFEQREPKNMHKFIKLLDYDFVFASCYGKDCSTKDDTIVTKIRNYFFTKLVNILFKLKTTDSFYTFFLRIISSSKKLNLKKEDFSFCVELSIKKFLKKIKILISNQIKKRYFRTKKVNVFKGGLLILISMINFILYK